MLNLTVLIFVFSLMPSNFLGSSMLQSESSVKPNKAQKISKATDKVEKTVREDEKGWTLRVRSRTADYSANEWVKDKEQVSCVLNVEASQSDAETRFKQAPFLRSVSPISERTLANLGDAAILLKYTTVSTVVVRKGNYLLTVTASSEALAEKFARLYDAAIIVE